MMVVGKQRSFTTEDGGVFTSYNAQEMREIDSQTYAEWLAETADATLRRIDAYEKALNAEQSMAGFRGAGIPETWSMECCCPEPTTQILSLRSTCWMCSKH